MNRTVLLKSALSEMPLSRVWRMFDPHKAEFNQSTIERIPGTDSLIFPLYEFYNKAVFKVDEVLF